MNKQEYTNYLNELLNKEECNKIISLFRTFASTLSFYDQFKLIFEKICNSSPDWVVNNYSYNRLEFIFQQADDLIDKINQMENSIKVHPIMEATISDIIHNANFDNFGEIKSFFYSRIERVRSMLEEERAREEHAREEARKREEERQKRQQEIQNDLRSQIIRLRSHYNDTVNTFRSINATIEGMLKSNNSDESVSYLHKRLTIAEELCVELQKGINEIGHRSSAKRFFDELKSDVTLSNIEQRREKLSKFIKNEHLQIEIENSLGYQIKQWLGFELGLSSIMGILLIVISAIVYFFIHKFEGRTILLLIYISSLFYIFDFCTTIKRLFGPLIFALGMMVVMIYYRRFDIDLVALIEILIGSVIYFFTGLILELFNGRTKQVLNYYGIKRT